MQNVLAAGRVRSVVPDTLKWHVPAVNQLSCGLFFKCIVTINVAARTEVSAAVHLLVLQVRVPSGV